MWDENRTTSEHVGVVERVPRNGHAPKDGHPTLWVIDQKGIISRDRYHSISVVVPTKNESGSIEPLVARLSRCLNGSTAEVIFADDSNDDTPLVIEQVAATSSIRVVCLHRQ